MKVGIVGERLARQFLTTPGPDRPSDVVRALGAVQAQDYAGAKWALGQRTPAATDADVERECDDGRILRTHVLRPTWHFVAPGDIRWMLALTGPRVKATMASYDRTLELTPAIFTRSNDAIAKALAGGRQLTRAALGEVLRQARIREATGQRLAHLMMRAELDAIVCSGARQGKQSTYALLDERAPPAPARDRDDALLTLTRRYFTTRGPATVHDCAWWSGLTVGDVKRGVQMAGTALQHATVEGREMYWTEQALPPAKPSAHLLPNYDEYFIGYRDRSAAGVRLGHLNPVTGGSALIGHVVFVDGQLVGGWKRSVKGDAVTVELTLLVEVSAAERKRVTAAVTRLGAFLEAQVEIRG